MKPIQDLFHDLVDRRLWPVAALLVIAIVAVPVLLSSKSSAQEDTVVPAAAPADPSAPTAVPDTEVLATTASGRGLRADKATNPFVYRGKRAPKKHNAEQPATKSGKSGDTGGQTTTTGSQAPAGGGTGATPAPAVTPTYQTVAVKVRFGRVEKARKTRGISRLDALPSADNPVLIYMGVIKGTKTAVFLISNQTHAEGDGTCKPSAASCQTVRIKEGQTEFFDVTNDQNTVTQYQLDLVDVKYARTKDKSKSGKGFYAPKKKSSTTRTYPAAPSIDHTSQRLSDHGVVVPLGQQPDPTER